MRWLFSLFGILGLALLTLIAWGIFALWQAVGPDDAGKGGMPPTYAIGSDMPAAMNPKAPAVSDITRGRVYVAHHAAALPDAGVSPFQLLVFQTETAAPVDLFELPFQIEQMALSHDGTRLYLIEKVTPPRLVGGILILDTSTRPVEIARHLYVCPVEAPDCGLDAVAVGPDERLYILPRGAPMVDIVSGRTGELLEHFHHPEGRLIADLAVHEETLFIADHGDGPEAKLRRFAIDGEHLAPEYDQPLPERVADLQVAPDGSFLVACSAAFGRPVYQFDARTLRQEYAYELAGDYESYHSAAISSDSAEVVLQYSYTSKRYAVAAYSAGSHDLLRVSPFRPGLDNTDHVGILPLGRGGVAHLYATLLQVLQRPEGAQYVYNYCGERFTDHFDNRAGGWPMLDVSTTTAFRYVLEEYSIVQREAGRWSGVTRPNAWDGVHPVSVRARLAENHGSAGLVFGLNDDWTQFYSFEIIPTERRWVLFRYADGQWQLLGGEANSNVVRPPGEFNELSFDSVSAAGRTLLRVNGLIVHELDVAIRDGRVGLGARSDQPAVDARFDDYAATPPACPLPAEPPGAKLYDISLLRPALGAFAP